MEAFRARGRQLADRCHACGRTLRDGLVLTTFPPHRRGMAVKRSSQRVHAAAVTQWRPRSRHPMLAKAEDLEEAPLVTAHDLRSATTRPRNVKMLMSDFIDDSLYNPNYGYFSKEAVIFSPGNPFDFPSIRSEPEFYRELQRRYTEFEDELDASVEEPKHNRQLWHTPTELFRPHYAEAVARYLVANYRLTLFPYDDLIIYEIGAGRGTLMLNVLDYIRVAFPPVYERTQFRVIEISPYLAAQQRRHLAEDATRPNFPGQIDCGDDPSLSASHPGSSVVGGADQSPEHGREKRLRARARLRGHKDHVEIINRSIFDWNQYVSSPCFFLAMEVLDNFAHDCVRYDVETRNPQQCYVLIDRNGDFLESYSPKLDPLTGQFFAFRHAATEGRHKPLTSAALYSSFTDRLATSSALGESQTLPGYIKAQLLANFQPLRRYFGASMANSTVTHGLSLPEFIPTRMMQFFDILERYFPAHRLVVSDFHYLPDTIKGVNSPVVQTRFQRQTIPVTTPLVHQGYFDIFFPIDFSTMEHIYQVMTGKLTRVTSHANFMHGWAAIEETRTRNKENPLLSFYRNASFMVTI